MQLGCKYIFKKLRKIQQHVTSVLIWNIHLKNLNQEIVLNSFWLLLFYAKGIQFEGVSSRYFYNILITVWSSIWILFPLSLSDCVANSRNWEPVAIFPYVVFFAHPLQDWIENSFFSAWILQYREYLQTKEFNFKILIFFVVLVIFRIVRAEYFIRSKRDRGVWKNIIYDEAKLV